MTSYAQRIRERAQHTRSLVCVGVDPTPETLELHARGTTTAQKLEWFCRALVEGAAERAVAVKPQSAWFEHAGLDGIGALHNLCSHAREVGLLVVLDAKRGDVPHTMRGYAEAYLGDDAASGICADALTVNISIGSDALAEATEVAHERGTTLYALAHTSNPGAERLQRVRDSNGVEWWHRVCELIDNAGVGAVVGATYPDQLEIARELMPDAPLLIPGIGAQGGDLASIAPMLQMTPDGPTPLIAVSRAVLPPQKMLLAGSSRHSALSEFVAAQTAALADESWAALVPSSVAG